MGSTGRFEGSSDDLWGIYAYVIIYMQSKFLAMAVGRSGPGWNMKPENFTNDWSEAPLRLTTLWLPCGSSSIAASSCGPLERSLSSDLDLTCDPRLQTYLGQVSPSYEKHRLSSGAAFFLSSQPQNPKHLTLCQMKNDKYLTHLKRIQKKVTPLQVSKRGERLWKHEGKQEDGRGKEGLPRSYVWPTHLFTGLKNLFQRIQIAMK